MGEVFKSFEELKKLKGGEKEVKEPLSKTKPGAKGGRLGGDKAGDEREKPSSGISDIDISKLLDEVDVDGIEEEVDQATSAEKEIGGKINQRWELSFQIEQQNRQIEDVMGELQKEAKRNLELSVNDLIKNEYRLAVELGILEEEKVEKIKRMRKIVKDSEGVALKEEVKKRVEEVKRTLGEINPLLEKKLEAEKERFSQEIDRAREYVLKRFSETFKEIEDRYSQIDKIEAEPEVSEGLIKELIEDWEEECKECIDCISKMENINHQIWNILAILLQRRENDLSKDELKLNGEEKDELSELEKLLNLSDEEKKEVKRFDDEIKKIGGDLNKETHGDKKNKIDTLKSRKNRILGSSLREKVMENPAGIELVGQELTR